jgi:transcriptional regulator with XRE-family HTH domain
MSVAIAGVYIRALRDKQGLTQRDVMLRMAEQYPRFNVDTKKIWAVESNERGVKSPLLHAIVRVLGGSADDLGDFLVDDSLTRADAIQRAEERLAQGDSANLYVTAQQSTNSLLRAIAQMLKKMENDPEKLARIVGYLEGLIDHS